MTRMRIAITALMLSAVLFALGALQPMEVRSEDRPDAEELAASAVSLLESVRAEADPTVIPEARRLLERSLAMQPSDNFAASLGMASLSNTSHDFSTSVKWSRRAIEIEPYAAAPYGLLGDALFELGRIKAADTAYQHMIDLRPDVGSYVRASYSAQFHGNHDDAVYALRLALDAAPPVGETPAFIHHQLGDVYATLGDFERSERVNRVGTKLAPGYVPPTVGIAESLIARGRYEEALPIMERAADELPALEYLVTLGDLYRATGDEDAAARTYDRAARRFALYRDSGVLPDHDFVTFYADHGFRPEAALEEARFIYADRPTAAAADTLGWALHSAGRDREAWSYMEEAIAGTELPDATLHFHAAAIAEARGHEALAGRHARRALRLDPHFSLFHLETAQALAR